jgi:hypothetical protein
MNPVRYEAIAPNIAQVDVSGSQVQVTWKDPFTGRQVGQSTGWMAADTSIGNRVQASVKRSIVYEVVYGIARFIASRLGGSAGRIVSNATYTAAGDINARATARVDYTEASRQAAIVAAFEAVRGSFAWDEERQRFVARQDMAIP